MSGNPNRAKPDLATRVANRHLLDQDQLLTLVEELHSVIVSQQQTVQRQSAAITNLQQRGGDASAQPATPSPIPRRTARPVAGSEFTIVFDGGAIGNPGKGYGSYQIVGPTGVVAEQKLQYGDKVTNNQAEFLTLIRALEDLRGRCGADCKQTSIAVRGDSQLVLNTVAGRWKARHPGLIPLHEQATGLLREFGETDIEWQPRSESVAILGH